MANTLGIQERTLSLMGTATDDINKVDPTGAVATIPRKSPYQPIVVRAIDHEDNDGAETTDPDKMAIFTSAHVGAPWKKDTALKHIVYKAGVDPLETPVDVTVLFPNFDYSTFE